MELTDPRPRGKPEHGPRGPRVPLARLARRVGAAISEASYAQRRLTSLRMSFDSYLNDPSVPPADYAEFRLRTSGPLLHEPTAGQRAAGRQIQ